MGKKSHCPAGPSLTPESPSTETLGFSALLVLEGENSGHRCGGRDAVGEPSGGGGSECQPGPHPHPFCPTGASL